MGDNKIPANFGLSVNKLLKSSKSKNNKASKGPLFNGEKTSNDKGVNRARKNNEGVKTYYANLTPEKGSKETKKITPDIKTYYANLTPDVNNTNKRPKKTK